MGHIITTIILMVASFVTGVATPIIYNKFFKNKKENK